MRTPRSEMQSIAKTPANDGGNLVAGPDGEPFRLRSYQAEMVEESMRSNIICVMDTGSGKTHIAIDRTRAELESCPPDKIVWFLAPTVTLCEQQYEVFKTNLPGYGIELLSGKDNVDHWTEQAVWDAVLLNVRIVLSTHQVLLDALTHAFVKISRLALLIFDEAHHCTLNHPAHRIMSDFYMPRIGDERLQLPRILGLSASPVMKATASQEDLEQIEHNLCAIVRTPKLHRSELMRYVHIPQLSRVMHPVGAISDSKSGILSALKHAYASYDLNQDPYVLDLFRQHEQGYDVLKAIQKVSVSGKTYCRDHLRSLVTKAEAMSEELGSSSMEWYLSQCIARFAHMVQMSHFQLFEWSADERSHLLKILTALPTVDNDVCKVAPLSLEQISRKVDLLVDLLISEAKDDPYFTCLVFVEQRVWVACIAEILAQHPGTKDLLRVGTFVGTSQDSKRKANLATLAEPRNQQTTLDNFRSGALNLILATSVLEEGIDVSSCHLVICFERPKNLKSFVQRRGRARKEGSKYVIFMPETGGGRHPESWQSLEEEMKTAYLDDLRKAKVAQEKELQDEDGHRFFEVPSTGALLTLDNASQHLHHFCALLGSTYVDTRPQFEFTETTSGRIRARVMLPISVDPAVRIASGIETWATERLAKQDAAFEAYKALYQAGLVNDHLLPAVQEMEIELADLQIPDHRPSLIPVSPTIDPWPLIARHQHQNPHTYYRTRLTLRDHDGTLAHMLLLTPTILPTIPEVLLHWNRSTRFRVESSWLQGVVLSDDEIAALRSITYKILFTVYQGRMQTKRYDFLWLIAPCDPSGNLESCIWPSDWNQSPCSARKLIAQNVQLQQWGLVNQKGDGVKYIPKAIVTHDQIQVTRLPKRRDFLHTVYADADGKNAHTKIEEIAVSECFVDPIPAVYSMFALFIPSMMHRFDVSIIAETLRTTLLAPIALASTDLPLITRALQSSAADAIENYQRLEFLGDCILKFVATVHLMAANPSWPESYLTAKKGKIVSNGFLARAALASGLNSFMITKSFTGLKWAPRYAGDLLAEMEPAPKVERSSKIIADIVESLIGASYMIGGFEKAYLCVQTLLPLEPWTSVPDASSTLHEAAPQEAELGSFSVLETLVGRTFKKKTLLLEALTHASFSGPHAYRSYERLEFLGDAVLDYIISERLYAHEPPIPHQQMHAIRTATVNASFLAFRQFETSIDEETTDKATIQTATQQRALWQFLRSGSPELNANRDRARGQHQHARAQIINGLNENERYPWHLFALTDPPKFLSDIVESVIGAVYTDSHGSIPACETVVRRLGILDCLEHILQNAVDCLHPKERLGHLAVDKGVQYVRVTDDTETNGAGDKMYKCQVKVGGEAIGGVVEGLRRLNAETIAAWEAVGVLESRNDVVMEGASEAEEFFDAQESGLVPLDEL